MEKSKALVVKVKDQAGKETYYRVGPGTRINQIKAACCREKVLCVESMRFLFDGRAIGGDDTVSSLGMEDGDQIDAHLEQCGC